jgi:hypothetical protein
LPIKGLSSFCVQWIENSFNNQCIDGKVWSGNCRREPITDSQCEAGNTTTDSGDGNIFNPYSSIAGIGSICHDALVLDGEGDADEGVGFNIYFDLLEDIEDVVGGC